MSMDNMNDDDNDGFEDFDNDLPEVPPPAEGAAPANRAFLLAIGVIGGLFLIGLIALALFWFLGRGPGGRAAESERVAATNQALAQIATGTADAIIQAATEKAAPTRTLLPATNTPVVVVATNTPRATATVAPPADAVARTATVAAFLTQSASIGTGTPGTGAASPVAGGVATSTALPTTGFADEVGLPGLFGVGALLLVVLFVARRLRLSGN